MDENVQTINTPGDPSPPDSTVSFETNLISTVGLEAPKAEEVKEEARPEEPKEDRFDQHPRWKEIMSQRDTFMERALKAEAQLQAKAPEKPAEKPELDFKDLDEFESEKIQEWMDEDPKGFYANLLRQARHEIREEVTREIEERNQTKSYESRVEQSYKDYVDKNPDFTEAWNTGSVQKYMDEHPGHNAMSAHMAMTMEDRIASVKKETEKEAEKRILENLKAKGNARGLEAGPSTGQPSAGVPDELQNPDKYGGKESVLLSRFLRRAKGQL